MAEWYMLLIMVMQNSVRFLLVADCVFFIYPAGGFYFLHGPSSLVTVVRIVFVCSQDGIDVDAELEQPENEAAEAHFFGNILQF